MLEIATALLNASLLVCVITTAIFIIAGHLNKKIIVIVAYILTLLVGIGLLVCGVIYEINYMDGVFYIAVGAIFTLLTIVTISSRITRNIVENRCIRNRNQRMKQFIEDVYGFR